jgi:hypothetical protein
MLHSRKAFSYLENVSRKTTLPLGSLKTYLSDTLLFECLSLTLCTTMTTRNAGLRQAAGTSCPPPNPLPVFEDGITLNPGDEVTKAELKREADRQTLFQKIVNDQLGSPNGYRKVEVLIIRWDQSIDQFKGHTQEVRTSQGFCI